MAGFPVNVHKAGRNSRRGRTHLSISDYIFSYDLPTTTLAWKALSNMLVVTFTYRKVGISLACKLQGIRPTLVYNVGDSSEE